ncbi:MAG: hypothetical protein CMP23_16075 [Rickettsiales bacterium]|nr:hypothetical protein [Rickettsiales bacterium]|tara:strand:- start:3535 stop:3951 length:417 start_codon:yes stop_codon:yes gene_type:complete
MSEGGEQLKDFLRELPPGARPLFWNLFRRRPVGKDALRDALEAYVRLVKATVLSNERVNQDAARALARGLALLLKEEHDGLGGFDQRLLQAAVFYFVEDDDGDADFDSEDGFDDDIEVFNAVAERFGRGELAIDLLWG